MLVSKMWEWGSSPPSDTLFDQRKRTRIRTLSPEFTIHLRYTGGMSDFSPGGIIFKDHIPWATTHAFFDDECWLNRDAVCQRTDEAHHYEFVETRRMQDRDVRRLRGRCLHRHTVPVDLALTGEVVALLCRNCWAQLPA